MNYLDSFIPYDVKKGSWDEFNKFYSYFTFSYFVFRFFSNKMLKNFFVYEESISRIFSSLSQILIIYFLFGYGPCWGTHAFLAYVINDMAYSIVFKPYLDTMIYIHHTVGVLISIIGLYVLEYFEFNSIDYQNCFKVTASLLAMEMSAPLLSLLWISKREPKMKFIKEKLIPILKPILYLSYVTFRLIVPEYIFFMVFYHPWNFYLIGYFFVAFFVQLLLCMQIYWFIKLLK